MEGVIYHTTFPVLRESGVMNHALRIAHRMGKSAAGFASVGSWRAKKGAVDLSAFHGTQGRRIV